MCLTILRHCEVKGYLFSKNGNGNMKGSCFTHCMSFSGPYFPAFGLNADICRVSLRMWSKYEKIRIRKKSVFGHFSRSDNFSHFAYFLIALGDILFHQLFRSYNCYFFFYSSKAFRVSQISGQFDIQKH